ncbi:hypothetical protein DFS34DRAFT_645594 [Phlyctochytrium arcticum]|nr:hypothetical protein DFS34DRAFT_645594 [Phlyctochytrium arcticum]
MWHGTALFAQWCGQCAANHEPAALTVNVQELEDKLEVQELQFFERVSEIQDASTKEIERLALSDEKLNNEVVALEHSEMDLSIHVERLEKELKVWEERGLMEGSMNDQVEGFANEGGSSVTTEENDEEGKEGNEEKNVVEGEEEEEEESAVSSEMDEDDHGAQSEPSKVGQVDKGIRRRSQRKRQVICRESKDFDRLQEIEVVNVKEFTALVNDYLTHEPFQINPNAVKHNQTILNAIKKAMPDVDVSMLKTLAQGVGSSFLAEKAANAAFLTLLQQIFAAASAAISFRQLATLCHDKYFADRRRKLGKQVGPTHIASLMYQRRFKSVVFKKMKEANDAACTAFDKSNVHYEKNFSKCVGVGQFIIDLVDTVGPGVAFRFLRESNLSYSSLLYKQ